MQQVRNFRVGRYETKGGKYQIFSLGLVCPRCDVSGWFEFDQPLTAADALSGPRYQPCSACGGAIHFYVLKPPSLKQNWLWAHPARTEAHAARPEVAGVLGELSEALAEAYEGAASVLATGNASPAATEARRTLEGLVKHLLEANGYTGSDRTPLAQLIKELSAHVDLEQPLTETAEAVRDGGNLGAHFDMKRKATIEMARETIGLVEAMVDYLLLLPRRVANLRRHLEDDAAIGDEGTEDLGEQ